MNGSTQWQLEADTGRRARVGGEEEGLQKMGNGLRQVQWLLLMLLGLLLAACGGGGSDGGSDGGSAPVSPASSLTTLSGVAATGAAVQGIVTLKDVPTGKLQATHTDDGHYTFNVTGLSGPFLLRVVSDDRATTLYGMALKSGDSSRGHLNPLTNRIFAALASGFSGSHSPLVQAFNAFPGPFAELDAEMLTSVTQYVLLRTSPYFRQRLVARGVSPATVDPVAGPFVIGQGLDRAFDDVRFFFDDTNGDSWEKSAASGEVVGAVSLAQGIADPWDFFLGPDGAYLLPGTSQALTPHLQWPIWWSGSVNLPVRHGVRWELSDTRLASIDEEGVVTAKAFTGNHSLTVTGYYQLGDTLMQDSTTLTLVEQAPVASVSMSELPAPLMSGSSYSLFTTVVLTPEAGGGTLQLHGGSWSLVDPDPYAQAAVWLVNSNGQTSLSIGPLLQDMDVRLRAVQTIAGQQYVTEKVVTLKKHVRLPQSLQLYCPSSLNYDVAATCQAYVSYEDGSSEQVVPELSVEGDDAAHVTVSGDSLTSHWADQSDWGRITVTGRYEGMTAVQVLSLNARQLQVTALEVVGVEAMPENANTTLQAWATWDDGSRADVTSSVSWSSSDTAAAEFVAYSSYGNLRSYYLLDQQADKVVTVTASICPRPSYGCTADQRFTVTHPVTVRNASLALVGLDLTGGVLGYGFAQQGQSYTLTARAIWNKKRRDGTPYTTDIASGVEWSSDNTAATVSGNLLTIGATSSEHLALITARYRDPNDAGVMRTARRVFSLYSSLNTPRTLHQARLKWGNGGTTYVLGGDGLARPLEPLPSPLYGRRVGVPAPFITRVKQVVRTEQGWAYLRDDGTVWYPMSIASTSLSQEMREQLVLQTQGSYEQVVPRPIAGLSNIVMLATTDEAYFLGALYAMSADGTVYRIKLTPTGSGFSYSVSMAHTGVSRIVSGETLHLLKTDGSVARRTDPFFSNTEQVRKADSSVLTGIMDVSLHPGGGMALAGDGTLWSWGSNYKGQLGLGDNTTRSHASPITSVTGFSQLASLMPAALRNDGTLWSWGIDTTPASTLPQRVGNFTGLTAIKAGYVVAADSKVWWWGRDPDSSSLVSPLLVFVEGSSDGPQLTLP